MLNGRFFLLNNSLSNFKAKNNFPIKFLSNVLIQPRFCSTVQEGILFPTETNASTASKKLKRFGIVFPEKKFDKVPELPVINTKKIQITPFRSHNTTKKNNKNLHTQIEMRFEVEKATWIPIEIRSVLYERTKHKLNKNGELIIAAFKYKTRQANYRDALNRIKQLIVDARNVAMGELTDKDRRAYVIHRNRNRRARRRKKVEEEALRAQAQNSKIESTTIIQNTNLKEIVKNEREIFICQESHVDDYDCTDYSDLDDMFYHENDELKQKIIAAIRRKNEK